jgi:DNA-binding IclR family transcriptional regulator
MRTRRELITSALQTLRVLAAGETSVAEDTELAADAYSDLLATLRDRGLAYWTDTGADVAEIPRPVFRALSDLLAADMADAFGKEAPAAADDDGRMIPAATKAMRELRRHMAKRPSGEPTPFSSY